MVHYPEHDEEFDRRLNAIYAYFGGEISFVELCRKVDYDTAVKARRDFNRLSDVQIHNLAKNGSITCYDR